MSKNGYPTSEWSGHKEFLKELVTVRRFLWSDLELYEHINCHQCEKLLKASLCTEGIIGCFFYVFIFSNYKNIPALYIKHVYYVQIVHLYSVLCVYVACKALWL